MRKLKLKFKLPNSILIKLLRRFLPTLVGLALLSAFFQKEPKLASQFAEQLLEKFGVTTFTTRSQPNLTEEVNKFRVQNSKAPLAINQTLNSLAHVLALSMANSPDKEPEITLKQAAQIVDYDYEIINYFAIISPKFGPTFSPTNWLTDNQAELLSTEFTQIGSSVIDINKDSLEQELTIIVTAKPLIKQTTSTTPSSPSNNSYYSGTQLWSEVQKYRREHGVPEFKQDNLLCTISSIRLNQLLELGRLDNHDGFEPLVDRFRSDGSLTHTNIGENLLAGYSTPQEAVSAWDNSPGHQALLKDGAYVFACTSANHGYAVLIAAF